VAFDGYALLDSGYVLHYNVMHVIFITNPPPPPLGEAGYSIERRCTYVRVCVCVCVCDNFAAPRRDPCCSSTLVKFFLFPTR